MAAESILEFNSLAKWLAGVLGAEFVSFRRGDIEGFPRPGILFEKPTRVPKAQSSGTEILVKTTQAATIFTIDEAETMDVESKLLAAIGATKYRIPIYETPVVEGGTAPEEIQVGVMRQVEITVKDAASGSMKEAKGLDIPLEIRYEVTLQVPAAQPPTLQKIISKGV